MLYTCAIVSLAAWLPLTSAFTLVNNFTASNWMSSFQVISMPDPTGGFVNYVSAADAQSLGLYQTIGNQIYIGVDNTTVLDPNGTGRNSVRLQSNAVYNDGLFIADFAHIPGSACVLTADPNRTSWLTGPTWPQNGEIDIIEGINAQTHNQVTIHTSPGCNVTVGQYGQLGSSGANTKCGIGGGYNGCTVFANTDKSYGTGFNAANGGVYALHWTNSEIKVWLFSEGGVPSDITNQSTPTPNRWGTPQASFVGCAFDSFFKNNNLMFDTTFCGDWAGKQWGASSTCSKLAPTCDAYAAANPAAYSQSYWLINSVRVYTAT
ncbi:MAG: hypothetical protein LQ340_000243 [Diploschistes diacapsis]|nr:MAG: hypothetical protein LQ340_000243 [Diploschistes diacapsis]